MVGEAVLVAVLLAGVVAAVVEEAGEVVGYTVVQGEQVEAHGGLTQPLGLAPPEKETQGLVPPRAPSAPSTAL